MSDDLLESSVWRPLRLLQEAIDNEIAALYDEAEIAGVRTRFVGPLIHLGRHESMTIQELATAMQVTHSAMSQTAASMRAAGLAEPAGGGDGRTRRIRLTERGRELLPFLQAEWRATEATIRELEAEIPYPLSRVVEDIQAALVARPIRQRLRDNLAKALDGRLR
jgi:DNA-binding MarR family transcriptional regulator